MNLPIVLSVIASLMHLSAFVLYNVQMVSGASKPNTATWSLWAVLTTVNATAYFNASGDWVKVLLPATSSIACILTFLFALARGSFKALSLADSVALAIGCGAGFAWWHYQSAVYANLILQVAVFVSIVPTYCSVLDDPSSEKAPPWALWGAAYVLMAYVVFLRSHGQWTDYVQPVQGALMHAAVVPLTWRKKS